VRARPGAVLQAYTSQEHLYGPSRAADRGFITVRDSLEVEELCEGRTDVIGLSLWISDEGCKSCDLAQGYIYMA